jgi:hypothetical protein
MCLDVYWCHPVACPPMEDGRFGGCTEWFLNGLGGLKGLKGLKG